MRAISSLLSVSLLAAGVACAQEAIHTKTIVHPDKTSTTTVIDPEKGTSEESTIDQAGKLIRKTTYLLDDRQQPIGSITSDARGQVLYRSSYVLAPVIKADKSDGYLIKEETISDPQGTMMRRRVYSYNAQGKVSGIEEYDANGVKLTRRGNPNARATPARTLPPRR